MFTAGNFPKTTLTLLFSEKNIKTNLRAPRMSKHKVSRGNTSDLIGLWNNRANTEPDKSGAGLIKSTNLLSVNPARKTSAYVPRKIVEDQVEPPKFRKTSAMVLLPTRDRSKSPVGPRSLNVDSSIYSPGSWKKSSNVSGLENSQTELPKLRSALKLSTVSPPPQIKTENFSSVTDSRRGSVGLGRSKSVCHKVKFVPQIVKENSTEISTGKPYTLIVLLQLDT